MGSGSPVWLANEVSTPHILLKCSTLRVRFFWPVASMPLSMSCLWKNSKRQPGSPQRRTLAPKGLAKGGTIMPRCASGDVFRGQNMDIMACLTASEGIVAVGSSAVGASGSRGLMFAKKVFGVV